VRNAERRARQQVADAAQLLSELAEEHQGTFALLDRRIALEDLNRQVLTIAGVECGFAAPLEADGLITIRSSSGLMGRNLIGLEIHSGLGLGGRVMAERKPVRVSDYGSAKSITHDFDIPVLSEGIRGTFAVPMIHDGQLLGVVWAAMREPAEFGDRVVREVVTVGRTAATRIHVGDLAAAQTQVALHAERRRLADELHDNLGASLFSIGAQIRTVLGAWDDLSTLGQDSSAIVQRLRGIESQLDQATATLRESLSALHQAEPTLDLAVMMRSDVEAFERRTSTTARLIVLSELPELEDARSQALVAVTREALLNVEKHAEASSVVVSVSVGNGGVQVAVRDDGVGLHGSAETGSAGTGLGLLHSAERLERLGGQFSIADDEDGATVRMWLPYPG